MALPDPFNTPTELVNFACYQQGGEGTDGSIANASFKLSSLESALVAARNEIYTATLGATTFTPEREAQLQQAELWLATAILHSRFGERIGLYTANADLASVGDILRGADTPAPVGPGSKSEYWSKTMYSLYRQRGLMLLEAPSHRWDIQLATVAQPTTVADRYPCLAAFQGSCCCDC